MITSPSSTGEIGSNNVLFGDLKLARDARGPAHCRSLSFVLLHISPEVLVVNLVVFHSPIVKSLLFHVVHCKNLLLPCFPVLYIFFDIPLLLYAYIVFYKHVIKLTIEHFTNT